MKLKRMLALATAMAMLVLMMASPLAVAEGLTIDNGLDGIELTDGEGLALEDIDLSDLFVGNLVMDLETGEVFDVPQDEGDTGEQDPTCYVVTFDACGGQPVPEAQQVAEGGAVVRPADPALEGFTFAGWTLNGVDFFAGENAVHGDICLEAKWEPQEATGEQIVEVEEDPAEVQSEDAEAASGQVDAAEDGIEVDLSKEGEQGAESWQETDLGDSLVIEDAVVDLEAAVEAGEETYSENVSASGADNDELFEGYFWRALEGGLRANGETTTGRKMLVDSGLTGTVKLYDAMKGRIRQVAAGQLSSTAFSFSTAELGMQGHWWTKEDLGLSSIQNATDERNAALKRVEGIDISRLSEALQLDLPYDLYWFDKNEGTRFSFTTETERQGGVVTRISLTSLTCSMYVSKDYSKSGGTATFDVGTMPGKVKNAVNNINDTLSKNANKGDYEKLKAYQETICKFAIFDHAKVGEGESGDVKQLIYVFDGDSKTKVVCQGYTKAFKYLCDRSTFQGDVECEMMSGYRKAVTEDGNHMWNVIKMSDGRYYLADITHCDSAGDDSTFMKGCTGNPGGPYVIKNKLTYLIGLDSQRFFGEGSEWLNYSHEDYRVNYDVSILAKKGRMSATPNKANPGTTITLNLQPAAGCGNADPVIKAGSTVIGATKVDDNTWTFVMPTAQVTAEVDFPSSVAGMFAIVTPESVIGGTLAVRVNGNDVLTAMTGDAIQLACMANNGYTVAAPQVNCSTGAVALTDAGNGIWTFVMPGDDVTIEPIFRAKDDWRNFQKQIDDAGNGSVIKLTQDLIATDKDFGLEISENKNITLDLNGHVIDRGLKVAGVDGFAIKVMGNLTLEDSSAGKTGVIRNAYNAQSGGAICVMPDAHLTLNGGRITDCRCTEDGGGIYVFKGSLTMNGGTIEKCTGENGGGILSVKGDMVITGGTISGNSATISGGGVYSYLGNLEIKGGAFKNNTAKDYGGGIYWRSEDSTLTISGKPTISGNKAVDGAGLWAAGPTVTVSGGTFDSNTCKSSNVGCGGGGLHVQADDFKLSGGTISGNSAKWGAGVYSVSKLTTVSGGTIKNNKCASSGSGGGLYVDDTYTVDGKKYKISTTLKVTGGTFSGNTANNGAGIYSKGKATTISGGTLKSNTAKTEGGGVYVKGDGFKLSGGTFSGNKAQRGGGVYTNTKSATVSKGTVKSNTASKGGGGIFANDTKFELSGSVTISDNTAPTGGGLYTKAGTTTIKGGNIKNNKGTNCGGGVYANGKSLTLSKGTISGNTAKNYGAGLYLIGSSAKMTGGTVKGNTSQNTGAGAYVNKGTFTVSGGSITGNTSKKYSGGVGLGKGSLAVSGSAVIFDNKGVTNGKSVADDVNVGQNKVIKVSGKLTGKAKIGVRGGPHVFTKGLGKSGNVNAFINNDTERYSISLNSSKGEAEIVK